MRGFPMGGYRRCAAALTLCAGLCAAQESRIHVDSTLVTVPIVATDGAGRLVRDLRRDELTITEDGVAQPIRYLWTEVDLPLTVALVIDVSSSQMGFVRAHLASVERFLTRVTGPADRVLIATVDEQARVVVDLTSSTEEMRRGVELIQKQRHAGRLVGEQCQPPQRSRRRAPKGCMGTAVWDGVFHVVRSELEHVEGRKALVLLSDGLDVNSSVHGLSTAIESAQTGGVAVYTIQYLSAGYLALSPTIAISAGRDHGMEKIAEETGGLAFHHPKTPDRIYDQIEADLRSQIILGFVPNTPAMSGKWRRLEVRCTRPGVTVRARAGYRAP